MQVEGSVSLPAITIARPTNAEDRFAALDLATALKERGIRVVSGETGPGPRVVLLRSDASAAQSVLRRHSITLDPAMKDEGYVITPDGNRIVVIGTTAAGVFYGAQTVKQIVSGDGDQAKLYRATIRDWPAMRYRGFHDDISRGPVPTLDFQKKQIRTLAAYKVNFFSPYFEHTLAYDSNPLIAPPGGAMTHADVKELVAYAANYHVDIVPEQEAFGHLHHALKYEIYSPLAETPHGHVLAPGQPGSLPLIRQMFAEINSLFPSRFVHLGADETFELGRGTDGGQGEDRWNRNGLSRFPEADRGRAAAEREEIPFLGRRRVELARARRHHSEGSHRRSVDVRCRYVVRPIHRAVSQCRNGDVGRARSEQLESRLSEQRGRACEYSALRARRTEARRHRNDQHLMGRRWRGVVQSDLVRRSLRRGRRVAGRGEQHRRVRIRATAACFTAT